MKVGRTTCGGILSEFRPGRCTALNRRYQFSAVIDRRSDRDSDDLSLAEARFGVVDSTLMSLSGLPNSPSTGFHDNSGACFR
jgi:hypothetical protein